MFRSALSEYKLLQLEAAFARFNEVIEVGYSDLLVEDVLFSQIFSGDVRLTYKGLQSVRSCLCAYTIILMLR